MSARIDLNTVDPVVASMIEKFAKFNQKVPDETRKDLGEIARLDKIYQKQQNELYEIKIEYLANLEKLSGQQKVNAFRRVHDEYEKMLVIGVQKAEIAKQMRARHEAVLDEFGRDERMFLENWPQSQRPVHRELREPLQIPVEPVATPSAPPKKAEIVPDVAAAAAAPKKGKRGRKRKNEETMRDETAKEGEGDDRAYCWCQMERVDSPMVMCENPGCKYEWFHFECIGMTDAPDGDWFCNLDCQKKGMVAKRRLRFEEKEAAEELERAKKRK